MSEFVVRNQLGQFWGKKKAWVDGRDAKRIMLCKHEDEGVNLLVELSAKDIDLRGEVVAVEMSDRGLPQVEPSEHLIEDEPAPAAETEPESDSGVEISTTEESTESKEQAES